MSQLTQAQIPTLHAAILANATALAFVNASNDFALKDWLNSPTTFVVWKSYTLTQDIQEAIVGANFTPVNPITGQGQDAANWMIACQGKQMNLQLVLGTSGTVATGKPNARAWLFDALTAVPSGKNVSNVMDGSTSNVGLANVKLICQRFATNAEKVFATGTGTSTTPGDLQFEYTFNTSDIPYVLERIILPS